MANSWRCERWDSMTLLTPNWQSGLPGLPYDGADPDGYMTAGEVADLIMRFAVQTRAPVLRDTNVTSLRRTEDGYELTTSQGEHPVARGAHRDRSLQPADGACTRPGAPAADRAADPVRLPQSRPAP